MKNSFKIGALALGIAIAFFSCGSGDSATTSTPDSLKKDSLVKVDSTAKKDTVKVDATKKDTVKK